MPPVPSPTALRSCHRFRRAALGLLFAGWLTGCSTPETKPDGAPSTDGGNAALGGTSGSAAGGNGPAGSAGVGGPVGNGGVSPSAGAGGASSGAPSAGTAGSSGAEDGGTAGSSGTAGNGGRAGNGGNGGEAIVLDPSPGNYRQMCDGSLGVFVDAEHFLDGNDEDQGLRLYRRGADANPLGLFDVSSSLGLSSSDEADFEDAARVGDRIYVVSSHGRDSDGNLERERYRFFATDISGVVPNVTLTAAGSTTLLLDQMLSATNWATPNTAVIATLAAAADLDTSEDEDLAPEANGTSIEALAWFPTGARPKQLLVGFRNPTQGGAAVVVSLLNADAVLTGATASFGEATLLELDGLGLRTMVWSNVHAALLLLAGPKAQGGPYRLLRWAGPPSTTPVLVRELTGFPSDSSPEAIVVYPNTRDVQVLFDQSDHLVGDTICKDVTASSRSFSDAIVNVP